MRCTSCSWLQQRSSRDKVFFSPSAAQAQLSRWKVARQKLGRVLEHVKSGGISSRSPLYARGISPTPYTVSRVWCQGHVLPDHTQLAKCVSKTVKPALARQLSRGCMVQLYHARSARGWPLGVIPSVSSTLSEASSPQSPLSFLRRMRLAFPVLSFRPEPPLSIDLVHVCLVPQCRQTSPAPQAESIAVAGHCQGWRRGGGC